MKEIPLSDYDLKYKMTFFFKNVKWNYQFNTIFFRDVISTRWPYPIQDDHRINHIDTNACAQLDKSGSESSAPKDKAKAEESIEKGAMDEETVEIDLKGEQNEDQIMVS